MCDSHDSMRAGFDHCEGYGVAQHHDEGGVSFHKGSFHKPVFHKIGEVLVYVQFHVDRSQNNACRIAYFCLTNYDVFVYRYSGVFAGKSVDSYDSSFLVFRVGWPSYGRRVSFPYDFHHVSC